jgi:hypothetical protein
MKIMTIAGVILIAVGVVGLIYGGISYVSSENVFDVGSMHIQVDQKRQIPVSPIAGAVAVAIGVMLILIGVDLPVPWVDERCINISAYDAVGSNFTCPDSCKSACAGLNPSSFMRRGENTMNTKTGTLRSIGFIILSFSVLASTNYAQNPYWQRSADPHMVVVPVRSAQEIATDLENARVTRQLVIQHNMQAVERLEQIARAIDSRESSIDNINNRKDDAKDDNRKSEETSLKIEEKANKQAIDLLKRLKDLREAEVDLAKSEEDHADKMILVFQRESDLQYKRSEYNWPSIATTGDLARNTASQVLSELEVDLLELQKKLASATEKVASKQKKVVEHRMKLHKAQVKLGM